MDVLIGPYFAHPKQYLGLTGLWPMQSKKVNIFLRVTATICCLSTFIPHMAKVYELRHHFHHVIHCLPGIVFYIQYAIKTSSMILNQKKCQKILEQIRHDFVNCKGKHLAILHNYADVTRRISKAYAIYFFVNAFLYNFPAFIPVILDFLVPLNESRPLRPPRLIRYHIQKFDSNFWVLCLHGMVMDFLVMASFVGFDTLMLNCTQHACALFKIVVVELKENLGEIEKIKDSKGESKDRQTGQFYRKLVGIIVKHKRAIEFVELVESMYTAANFFVISITLGSITFAEFETVYNKHDHEIMIRYAVYASVELVHILFHNYPAQRIKDHSLMIYQSCYNSEWYRHDIPVDCKKLIILIMLRSQKPSCLTAAGVYFLGLENYAMILKASLSYVTFLTSLS